MEKGTPVKVKDEPTEGVVHAIFDNFDAIPEEYIGDGKEWWDCQEYPYEEAHKKERWIAVDFDNDGGQGIYAEHSIEEVFSESTT